MPWQNILWRRWGSPVVDFRQLSAAPLPQGALQHFQLIPYRFFCFTVLSLHLQISQIIGPQREDPHRSLVVGQIPL